MQKKMKRGLLLVLFVLVAGWVSWNLIGLVLQDWYRPFGPRASGRAFRQIEKRFTGPQGQFAYQRFEEVLLQEFQALDKEQLGDLDSFDFMYYILFLKTRRTEEIRNLIPVLEQHASSHIGCGWGEAVGLWPFEANADCYISVGDVCSEVLKHRNRLETMPMDSR